VPITREERTRRLLADRDAARAAGRRVGGAAPYGWRVSHGQLIPVPAEQGPRWLILHLRGKGWSLPKIAAELDRLSIPARSGRAWNPSAVYAVCTRAAELTDTG
jgi:hypothetical protein